MARLLLALTLAFLLLPLANPQALRDQAGSARPPHLRGVRIPGWQVRFDEPTAKIENVYFRGMGQGMHVTAPSAAIFWKQNQRATGDYTVSSSFALNTSPERRQAYGVFIGGADLAGKNPRYTAFVVRQDGKFLISKRAGAASTALVNWTENAAVMRPDKAGDLYSNLVIRVTGDTVRFVVNTKEVAVRPVTEIDTIGIAGIRVQDEADVHVAFLQVQRDGR